MASRPHLELILRRKGRASLRGGGKKSPETIANERNRAGHADSLRHQQTLLLDDWTLQQSQRLAEGRPVLPSGVPLLLKVDPEADIDFVRTAFGFEILCEQEDGFLLIATEDVDLAKFESTLALFEANARGGGSAAKLHSILNHSNRIERLLSPMLREIWPKLSDELDYTIDFSVECLGLVEPPKAIERKDTDSEATWQERQEVHRAQCTDAYQRWDTLRDERVVLLETLIRHYGGQVLGQWDDSGSGEVHSLPDSFSLRARVRGNGLRDVVQNYQYLFEVTLPEGVQQSANAMGLAADTPEIELLPPADDAPRVCVIDSGIQQRHVWLEAAMDIASSRCFLPGETDVGDHVAPSGHGTRVAGALL